MIKQIRIQTSKKMDMINITDSVARAVQNFKVDEGICVVYTPHTTAGITINENADPDVQRDMILGFEKIIPNLNYRHFELNSPSHMLSTLVGVSETLIVENSQLVLGTWQAIYFFDFDGPRERKYYVKIV